MLLRIHRTSAASRRCCPPLASGWSVCPVWCAASRSSARTLSASSAAPARTFSGSAHACNRWPPYRPDRRDRDSYGAVAG